jgi:hypothetical protein
MSSAKNQFSKRAIGLVVEYIVAIDVTRVRFPDGALFCSWDCPTNTLQYLAIENIGNLWLVAFAVV